MSAVAAGDMREQFVRTTTRLLEEDPRLALVLAEISAGMFVRASRRHPERVVNVGIREQLMISVAGGLALAGLRPIVHSYAPFLVERPFEQVKLDLGHQAVGAVLVSVGASYDWAAAGRTHHGPGDVALIDTLPGWSVHVPGHPVEADALIRSAAAGDDRVYIRLSEQSNALPQPTGVGLRVVRDGGDPVVVAVGPMLDPTLDALRDVEATVVYASTVRPWDPTGLLRALRPRELVLVEPYLAGTSAAVALEALDGGPLRLLSLGVPRGELRRYGSREEHDRAHGLDAAGLRRTILDFLGASADAGSRVA